ncbi:Sir2 family NAD-dependent protein deacetylase [Alicyclobacillus macrosporangiidus]|jgi:NAD-dependent deacetylase|uniref:protein acetyllysine N-acetyltransferase n=1 Tax=Alicyclobacillus macrosporangiidus TaxID=392015 RepID=A0A1I7KLW2_9BACL|nr:Sir2 family NAD-dependent protein deacetylase [Alicyclobacillus macrosporangiidus]SFU98409.1 NAD-dependent deacetylase [Alicyclobacillus macrosporangiidus]
MQDIHVSPDNVKEVEPHIRGALRRARFSVAVTGAGISCASGLPLLRERVEGVPLNEFFRAELWRARPDVYYRLYRRLLSEWRRARPNAAHDALARRGVWVITQNIDGLHRDAGTHHLIELHGNLRELRCITCGHVYGTDLVWRFPVPRCPRCHQVLHPGISLEGEEIRHYSLAVDWVGRCEVLYVVGTSLQKDPVRRLPELARRRGALVVWLNDEAERLLPRLLTGATVSSG